MRCPGPTDILVLHWANGPKVMKKLAKKIATRILRSVRPGLEEQIRRQREFDRLGRKPPELMWKACAPGPVKRTESGSAKIGHQFFLIGGFHTLDHVLNFVDVFDLDKRKWRNRFAMPSDMPHTHLGVASDDERYIYLVAGQLGPQCHPCVADCSVLDTQTRTWSKLPSLPEARYSPTVQLWRGRLHALSGSRPDRRTPACDHWSIAVDKGKALENRWREEASVPRGGPHRGSVVFDDRLYLLGGQEGDIKPFAGNPQYPCDWNTPLETTYCDSFMLAHGTEQWKPVSPMPNGRSHTECAFVKIGQQAVVVGGVEERYKYSDLIQIYDTRTDRWRAAGRLPYVMKTNAVYHKGWLFVVTGQRGESTDNPRPSEVLDSVWRAKFDPAQLEEAAEKVGRIIQA